MFNLRSLALVIFSIAITNQSQAMNSNNIGNVIEAIIDEKNPAYTLPWLSENFTLDDNFFNMCRQGLNPHKIMLDTGETTLIFACRKDLPDAIKKLRCYGEFRINAQDAHGNTALHYACYHKNIEIVRCLMELKGIDPNIKNKMDTSPVNIVNKGMQNLDDEIAQQYIEIYGLIIKKSGSKL